MPRKRWISPIALAAALLLAALLAPGASATTFCVPDFSAACPNSDGRVKEADLEKAMGTDASDGVADAIIIAAGTVTEDGTYEPPSGFKDPGSIEPAGTDPLTVSGAGPSATVITSSGSGNIYVLSLGAASGRAIAVRNLTVRIPAGFPDGQGAAVQLAGNDKLEVVDVVSLNSESDAVAATGTGNAVFGGEVRGEGAGSIDFALNASFTGANLTVIGTTLKQPSWGLIASGQGAEVTALNVTEIGARTYAAVATAGTIEVANSVLRTDDGIALYSSGSSQDSLIEADHVTAINSGGASNPAMVATKAFEGAGEAAIEVSNSILRGYESGYELVSVAGPGIGPARLTVRYSNFQLSGSANLSEPDLATGNIDVNPNLSPNGSLPAGSPSIDAADPAEGGLDFDILGALRPLDGNADCIARSDQGAFEYMPPAAPSCLPPEGEKQPEAPPASGPSGPGTPGGQGGEGGTAGGDRKAPQTSIAKGPGARLASGKATFKLAANEAGARFECKLDGGKRRPCPASKTYKGLAPGRHTFKAWATDAAGNTDRSAATRAFRVPPLS